MQDISHFVRSPYNYDRNKASDESGLECLEPSLTKQSDAESADINVIVKRFNLTGQMPQGLQPLSYSDFEGIFDFQSAMNAVRAAEESFMSMPAHVRERFSNNPQKFMDFCSAEQDGKLVNLEEMRKLGLAIPPEVVVEDPPQRVVVVSENGDGKD